MCGIAGIVAINKGSVEKTLVKKMCDSMISRGPNNEGLETFDNVCFGQRRLSIIDTSSNGNQPFVDLENKLMLVVNGEIYNYQELRHQLIQLGQQFKSSSDSEVILHGYKVWKEGICAKLRGMFAFALYDGNTSTIILARDRMGIKPLFYFLSPHSFIFSSEIPALLNSGLVSRVVSSDAISTYLMYGYAPQNIDFIEGVYALEPGTMLIFQNGQMKMKSFWQPPMPSQGPFDVRECVIKTRELLNDSIKVHLQSDVALGAFLSGGIDSAAVVGLATKVSGKRVATYSIGFEDGPAKLNELQLAKRVADYFGTEHHEYIVNGKYVSERLENIIAHQSMPSFDGINTYIISELAKKGGITVALSGLGGDELFGGYDLYHFLPENFKLFNKILGLPKWMKRPWCSLISRFVSDPARSFKFTRMVDVQDFVDFYALVRANGWPSEIRNIFSDSKKQPCLNSWPSLKALNLPENLWGKLRLLEMRNYMGWRLLNDTDMMSMAHALEVRVPLIDDCLVEYVLGLPIGFEKQLGWPKKMLTQSLEDVLPDFILKRPKQGFALPMREWMQNDLRDVVCNVFSEASIKRRGLFKYQPLENYFELFQKGLIPYEFVWKYVVLELWLERNRIEVTG